MDFGKLNSIDHVDFSLPPEPEANAAFFANRERKNALKVYLSPPVWADRGFVGKIYPERTKPADYLKHFSKHFQSIELNTTWYGVRTEQLVKWRESVPDGFLFCPKLTQQISQPFNLAQSPHLTHEFCQQVAQLHDHLGLIWLLCPPGFGPEEFETLKSYVSEFPADFELGVELRDSEWFRKPKQLEKAMDLFAEHGVTAIMTDVAGRRDVLHMRITAPTAMVRFVGNMHHNTDFERIEAWAKRIIYWHEQGLERLFFFMHQPQEDLNVEIALCLAEELDRHGLEGVVRPKLLPPPMVQGSLF